MLGGSRFLGRAIVDAAVANGWDVTCFRRGTTAISQPVRLVRGDRTKTADLERLAASGQWDAIVDTSAYIPAEVHALAAMLEPVARRYVLVSTVAVYKDWPGQPTNESSPTFTCPSGTRDSSLSYGALKAGCEAAVVAVFGRARTTILRPGAILGPHDYLGRLPWWLRRVQRGGRVLAPGRPERPIQPIDVRDVADFALLSASGGAQGVYNVAGPGMVTMADLLNGCRTATGAEAEFEWIDDEPWLASQGLSPWTSLPLWRIERGVWEVDSARARSAGLTSRALTDTITTTWMWLRNEPGYAPNPENGISPDLEQQLLRRWDRIKRREEPSARAHEEGSSG